MSTYAIVEPFLGKRLFVLPPAVKSDESIRTMIVSEEVLTAVDTEFPDNWDGLRHADFRNTLDAFTLGEDITVGEDPFKKPNDCFMARVHPVEAEVFDIRSLFGPGIRTFGSIVDKDHFLALTWDYRKNIDFEFECKRCAREWNQLFGSVEQFSKGKRLDECLTNFQIV